MRTLSMPAIRVGFLMLWCLLVPRLVEATTYYSRTNNGNWGSNSTWSTVGYGNATNTGTYPKKGDVAMIGDGYRIVLNINATCSGVTIGQGTSGILEYASTANLSLTVSGSVTVNNGGLLHYPGNNARAHLLNISSNFTNNGNVDIWQDADDFVNLVFNSSVNSVVSGSGTWDLNKVNLFKAVSTANSLDVQSSAFETAIRQLVLNYGTYDHNNTGNYQVNPSYGAITIDPNVIMKASQGILHLSPNANACYLQGGIQVAGGTVRVGLSSGLSGLRYDQNGSVIPFVSITSGSLVIYGGLTYRSGSSAEPFSYLQTNGTCLLNSGSTGCPDELFFVTNHANSSFVMNGGSIVLQKPNTTGSAKCDFTVNGSSGTVSCTGGTVEFGNTSTSSGAIFSFRPYASIVQPNFKVTGSAGATVKLCPASGSTADFKLISLYVDVNKTFDMRSYTGTTGDTRSMTLVDNYDGLTSLYNDGTFIARSSTVIFQGAEGLWVNGGNTVTFYKLTINNPLGVSLGKSINISNTLNLLDGVLYTSASNLVTCQVGASSNIGSAISYVDGPFAQRVASSTSMTLNLPIGKSGAYRPIILSVRHTNLTTITYTSEAWNSSARAMGYSLPGTLDWVSDVRYYTINRTNVANVNTARVTLSYGADDVVNDYTNLRVARYSGASSWLDIGGVGTANGSGSIQSGAFNAFNQMFTLANKFGGSNPLPVELVSFTAVKQAAQAFLNWTTASEDNSDSFEVERSTDGTNFISLTKMAAAGNSNRVLAYTYTDQNPGMGINYYRLKETDKDGTVNYSMVRSVDFRGVQVSSLYPNPAGAEGFSIDMVHGVTGKWNLNIYDLSGRVMFTELGESGDENKIHITPHSLPPGVYIIKLRDEGQLDYTEKLVYTEAE